MELEYREVYEELFDEQDLLLELTLEQKARAQNHLEEYENNESPIEIIEETKHKK